MPKRPRKSIWCCQCETDVPARLTSGAEVYPHRTDLAEVPMWICDGCRNSVGAHRERSMKLAPLGVIASPQIRKARTSIHHLIDPVWKSRRISRRALYAKISEALGYEYHTAEIKTMEEAHAVYRIAKSIIEELGAA